MDKRILTTVLIVLASSAAIVRAQNRGNHKNRA